MYVKYCNIFQFWVILHNILSFSWVWGFHGLFLPVALTEKKGLFFIGSIYSFSHDTTFWVDKAANFCSHLCQNWGNFKYEGFIQKCKQTGNFPKTLFLMIIQSKSNILSQFQNSRLVFTAKSDFHQNSCDMELKMAGALQGQIFQPFLWPMVSTIIGQKF